MRSPAPFINCYDKYIPWNVKRMLRTGDCRIIFLSEEKRERIEQKFLVIEAVYPYIKSVYKLKAFCYSLIYVSAVQAGLVETPLFALHN